MLSRKLQIKCSASKNPINEARVRFQAKRSAIIKDNFTKFVMIGTSEVKDIQTFIVELDEIHRKEVDKLLKKEKPTEDAVEADNIFIL